MKNRLISIDCLKLLCAFFVICIHIHFGIAGEFVKAAARIAVPIFFMITGYFYQSCVEKGNQIKQIKKILILIIFCNVFYFAFYSAVYAYSGIIAEKYKNWFSLKSLIKLFLLNESPFAGHIWYLNAILYVLIIVFLFEKKFKRQYLYFLIPLLLCTNLLLGNFSKLIFGEAINNLYTRNFLFTGLPFFLIGDYIHNGNRFNPIKCRVLILGILATIFMIATMGEYYIMKHFDILETKELFICSIFCAVFLFTFCIKINDKEISNTLIKKLAVVGNRYSTDIYIFHFCLITCLSKIVSYVDILETVYNHIAPIIVFAVTLIFAIIFEAILKKLKLVISKHRKNIETEQKK